MGLTGTKYGCGIARCGACTVLKTTREGTLAIRSCVTSVDRGVTGPDRVAITTVEGSVESGFTGSRRRGLPRTFPQCGYCQSGQIMATVALLGRTPHPTREQIDAAL